MYNRNNIFYKIIHKQVEVPLIAENENAICIKDIHPKGKTHLLVIPKGEYTNGLNFIANCNRNELNDFWNLVNEVCSKYKITNFKWEANGGLYAEVPHFHLHIISNDE